VKRRVLAFDFGASSGRAMIGAFDGRKIELSEIHRFSNDSVYLNGTLFWDTPHQINEIKKGINKCFLKGGADSIGIDTWGVDFGLLNKYGDLMENHVHYRDTRTNGMIEKAAELVPKKEIYRQTGIQFLNFNTLYQLFYLQQNRPELLNRADKLLMSPDLFNYFLTGEKHTEYTIASTSQLLDVSRRDWAFDLIKRLKLPGHIFTDIIQPGSQMGVLMPSVCEELGAKSIPVIAVASHDTASAVVAVPSMDDEFAYLSSGTWSLLGTERNEPIITEQSLRCNFTNEGGYGGKVRFLKNIAGLWLIQEARAQWQREGETFTFAEIEQMGKEAKPFLCFIDPDEPSFAAMGDIPSRIRTFCKSTGQNVPTTHGEIIRCIYESLALKYRHILKELVETTGRHFPMLYIIGGGTKDKFLCSLTANACRSRVYAGPVEATVLGNIAVQLISLGEISTLKQARQVIGESFEQETFEPESGTVWDDAYERYVRILINS
jgi:rhamnulokinase